MKHAYDEMQLVPGPLACGTGGDAADLASAVRPHYRTYARWLQARSAEQMQARREEA